MRAGQAELRSIHFLDQPIEVSFLSPPAVDTGQLFDLYYDRAMKNVDDRKGSWFTYRELSAVE